MSKTQRTYKRFLYLDEDAIINALALVRGGEIEQVVRRIRREKGGSAGLKLKSWVANIEVAGKRGKDIEEEIVLKQTLSAAIGELLGLLAKETRDFDGPLDLADIRENDLVAFTARIYALSSERVRAQAHANFASDRIRESFWTRFKNWFGAADVDAMQTGPLVRRFAEQGLGSPFIVIAEGNYDRKAAAAVLLELAPHYTSVEPEHLSRYATVVGQVECCFMPNADEEELVLRHGDPPEMMFAEVRKRSRLDSGEGSQGSIAVVREEDKPVHLKELVAMAEAAIAGPAPELRIASPSALIRPICVYK